MMVIYAFKTDLFIREKEVENFILLYKFPFNFKVKIRLFKLYQVIIIFNY